MMLTACRHFLTFEGLKKILFSLSLIPFHALSLERFFYFPQKIKKKNSFSSRNNQRQDIKRGQVKRNLYRFQIRLAVEAPAKKIVGGEIQFNVKLEFSSIFYLELLSFTIPYTHFIHSYKYYALCTLIERRVTLKRSAIVGHLIFYCVRL